MRYKFNELTGNNLKEIEDAGMIATFDGDKKEIVVSKPICEFCEDPTQPLYKENICEKCWGDEKMVGEDFE